MEFRHILCPIDFSDTSARALAYATAFAAWYDAQLTVLHVATAFDEPVGPASAGDAGRVPRPGSRDDIIARIGRSIELAGAAGLNTRALAQEGRVTELIVNCSTALNVDLLVMGTHGLGGFHRLVLGSAAEKVVRTATCPVLTVPPGAPATALEPVAFKKILCPIDFSPSASRALQYALELARQANGGVVALHALEYLEPEEPGEHAAVNGGERHRDFLDRARRRLHAQVAGESTTWCEIEEVVTIGRAYKVILEQAAASKADLVVMGAQGVGGIELMLYGSNTQHVVRAAACPVLTVRA